MIGELLATLSALGVKLDVRDGRLHVDAPAGALTPELREAIGQHKAALLERLQTVHPEAPSEELPRVVPDPTRRHEPFPLTDIQHAYWIGRGSQIELGEVSTYVYFELECPAIDAPRLTQALRKVVALHDMLRAVIDLNGQQRVLETVPDYEIAVYDLRQADSARRDAELQRIRAEMSHQVFPADRWPLFEVRLVQLSETSSRLCVGWDFLVVDAWSLMLIFRQWFGYYGDPAYHVTRPTLSFRDLVLAEARRKDDPRYQASKTYWWDRIDRLPGAPQLPVRGRIEKGRRHEFRRRVCRLPAARWDEIKRRARRSGLTPANVLLALFSEVLSRWAKQSHFCLPLTVFNRPPVHEEINDVVGDFTNLLVVEIDVRQQETFAARAARVQAQFLADFEHRQVSAVEVMREFGKRRGSQQQAMLPVVFSSTLMLDGQRIKDGGMLERFGTMSYGITQTPQVWLDYQVFDVNGDLVINWDAVEEVFVPGVLDDMFEAHQELLEALAASSEAWERTEPIRLSAAQQRRRAALDATDAEVVDACLHALFVDRACQDPARIALEYGTGSMSYGQLLAQANHVADQLLARHVQVGELVAIVASKGWEQVAAALGILLAGAAYVPIEPRWPTLRRAQLLERCGVRVALTQPALAAELAWPDSVERIAVTLDPQLAPLSSPPIIRQSPTDLAYVIFTSGSTGIPKGVMIDHRAAVNTIVHVNRLFGVTAADRALAVSDLSFDLSVHDIFGLLAAGGTLVIPDAALARDPAHWRTLIATHGITVWNSAPPLGGMLVDDAESAAAQLSPLRLVLLSGDWIPVTLPDRIRALAPGCRVVSLGGATEGAIWSIYYPIGDVLPEWDSIPYGKALPNQHMYVLDTKLQPRPDLVTGDIYIGGLGVALGYWEDPERTRAQFVTHPRTGERLYFTGDLGRVMRDGNIEFLGREDSQVKLRGHRVELSEITASIQSHPDVRDAVVQLIAEQGRSTLTAYVVAEPGGSQGLFEHVEVSADALRETMRRVVVAALDQAAAADQPRVRRFWDFWSDVEWMSARAMLETLESLELLGAGPAPERLDALVRTGRVLPRYRRLLERWLVFLVDAGLLRERATCYEVIAGAYPPGDAASAQLAALEDGYRGDPDSSGFLEFVASSHRQHLAQLSGEVAPLNLLLPNGSSHIVDALYEVNPIARHHNHTVAAIVRALVGTSNGGNVIRVLQIGARSGGTSAAILPELPAAGAEYWYTDASAYFLEGAKRRFAAFPFVRYATVDMNVDLERQLHEPHSFDVIVAANTLHNATDVDLVLNGLRKLLRPGGHLVMIEGTAGTAWLWTTAAFNLDPQVDERTEAGEPVLSLERWTRALNRCGFGSVQAFPAGDRATGADLAGWLRAMPQHVIVAQAPPMATRFRSDALATYLRERLPDYMVPQRYALLDRLPLTANGKVDTGALPRELGAYTARTQAIVLPQSDAEARIMRIWLDVLGVERLSVTDNFFEAGGDSLLITEVLRRLNQTESPPLMVAELFSYPTVRSLAAFLATRSSTSVSAAAAPRQVSSITRAEGDAIAIIGMAGRFPDAPTIDALWDNVAAGRCAMRRFTDDELLQAGITPEELADPAYVKAGVVLADMQLFDAAFFGMPPREAELMDPQQRFLLECAVEALEHAGYAGERFGDRIGVFVGKGLGIYFLQHVLSQPGLLARVGFMHAMNVNEKDFAATHISYKLNLTGPSLSVNTACSTSLVGVHLACQSLFEGECDIALAGAVSFVNTLSPAGYHFQEGHLASPDGYCRPFAHDAAGTIFGSGVGLVVLKPLSAAMRDGDTIHAVIRGSAINNDGSTKVGFTAPSVQGQAEVIARACARAGVSPDAIQLIEAHGTGTKLGDPVEFAALRRVFGGPRRDGSRCALGSIKSNFGHLDTAAGVTGLIKVVQALAHRQLPPTLHAQAPNPNIDFSDSPFYLNTSLADWPAAGGPRLAGISSFGFGGTNAHVIVEGPPDRVDAPTEAAGPQLLPISAKTRRALAARLDDLTRRFATGPELSARDVAFTLQVGRHPYQHRAYVVCQRLDEAVFGDRTRVPVAEVDEQQTPSVAFLFPGQGAQCRDTTAALYPRFPSFRRALDECADIVREYTGADLRDWLYSERAGGAPPPDIDHTSIAQPVLFAVEYALARFWESIGVRPAAMLGHSLGEYVAACLAGVFSLREALSLVLVRGRLLGALPPGRMLAAPCSEAQLRAVLTPGSSIAAVNGPSQCVAAGPLEDIELVRQRLESANVIGLVLRTSHAFHSPMVDPVLETFRQCVAELRLNPPTRPFISNVTGTWITPDEATSPAYWARHMREPVRFDDGVRTLAASAGRWLFLEVGPGHTLTTLVKRTGLASSVLPTLGYDPARQAEAPAVLDAVGRLWLHGVDIDWRPLHEGQQPRRVALPSYPFERKRFWIEKQGSVVSRTAHRGAAEDDAAAMPAEVEGVQDHDRPELRTPYVAPANDVEAALIRIWRTHLGVDGMGVRDSFFELGGDSLMAVRVHADVKREFDVELPLAKMFDLATVRRVALFIAVSRDPEVVDTLSEEDLDDCLAVMES